MAEKKRRNIDDLREIMFDAMADLKSGAIDVAKAKAMAGLGSVIVESAKAETAHILRVGGTGSRFIPDETRTLPSKEEKV